MKRITIAALTLALAVAGCSLGSGESTDLFDPAGGESEAPALRSPDDSGSPDAVPALFQTTVPFPSDVNIIRDGRLDIRIDHGAFAARWEELSRIAADLGGYVSTATTGIDEGGDERYAFGTAVLRVPADRFDDAVRRVGDLGERLSFELSSQDVTEEFVDLQARLRHLEAVEQFHLGLLEEAVTVDEALRVQQELQAVQLQIEQIEGRIRYLESRTSFSTLTAFLTEAPGVPAPVDEQGEIAQAFAEARRVIMATFGFLIVAAAALVPIGLLALTAFGLWRVVRRFLPRPGPAPSGS